VATCGRWRRRGGVRRGSVLLPVAAIRVRTVPREQAGPSCRPDSTSSSSRARCRRSVL